MFTFSFKGKYVPIRYLDHSICHKEGGGLKLPRCPAPLPALLTADAPSHTQSPAHARCVHPRRYGVYETHSSHTSHVMRTHETVQHTDDT